MLAQPLNPAWSSCSALGILLQAGRFLMLEVEAGQYYQPVLMLDNDACLDTYLHESHAGDLQGMVPEQLTQRILSP